MIKQFKIAILFFFYFIQGTRAQNWAPVPCFDGEWQISNMFVDSLQDEIILSFSNTHSVCGVNFKGCLAYNQNGFHNLDFGIDLHDVLNQTTNGGDQLLGSIPYNDKTLFCGLFASVGTNTLQAEALAQWDGNHWSNFPKYAFNYDPQRNNVQVISGMLRDNGKIWFYGGYQNIGGVSGKNLYTFDGNNFTYVGIPVSDFEGVYKMIKYKNKIIAAGFFYNYPSYNISKLAMFDGNTWSSVGNGVKGAFDGINDMVIYKDTLYLAGSMNKANGNAGNHIMKWDGTQLYDAGFGNYYGTDAIKQLVVYNGKLYAFGNFLHAANQKSFGIASYENGQWIVPQDSLYGSIGNAVVYKNELYISGAFQSIGSDPNIKYFAKLICPNFDAANGCLSGVKKNALNDLKVEMFPNPVSDKLTIEFENMTSSNSHLQISNTLGQTVYSIDSLTQREEINLSFLMSGIYYLKVENNEGQTVFKIVKE